MHANWTSVGRAGIPDEMCRESRKRTVQSVFLLGVKLLRMCEADPPISTDYTDWDLIK